MNISTNLSANLAAQADAQEDPIEGLSWPEPPAAEAYHGLAGEIVQRIEPHSEADPAGLLVQLLIAFGNVVGRGPYFLVEATRHSLVLFAVLVGATSKARKGTSWAHVHRLFAAVDPKYSRAT